MSTEEVKEKLLREKENLEGQLAVYKSEDPLLDIEQNISNTAEDDVTAAEGHDRIVATRIELKRRLAEVNGALEKIQSGKYGVCESCRKRIGPERLKAMPTAKLCLTCKAKSGS
jgi:RNA polymerase-binding transcription factor DksA